MSAMRVRKAVFPAAGLGTRFLPATKAQPKEMLPLVDKPTIQSVRGGGGRASGSASSPTRSWRPEPRRGLKCRRFLDFPPVIWENRAHL